MVWLLFGKLCNLIPRSVQFGSASYGSYFKPSAWHLPIFGNYDIESINCPIHDFKCYHYFSDLNMCKNKPVSWHLIAMGSTQDQYSIYFGGYSLLLRDHRVVSVELAPTAFATAEMLPSYEDTWLLTCQNPIHQQGKDHGMTYGLCNFWCEKKGISPFKPLFNMCKDENFPS